MLRKYFFRGLLLFCISIIHDEATAQCSVFIGNDTTLCNGSSLQVNANAPSGGIYSWSPATGVNNTNTLNPVLSPQQTTTYVLSASYLIPNTIANSDFSQGYTGFSSSYTIGTGGPYGLLSYEGTYGIGTDPSAFHTNFPYYPDHTTGNGNYMIVNGAGTPNTSIWCQTVNVVPNTNYQFGCWAMTIIANSTVELADLQFSINNVNIGNVFSPSLTAGIWSQFTATWNSGASTTANICIVNQNTVTSGNDFGLDDITFDATCTTTDSITINVAQVPLTISASDTVLCSGETADLNAVSNGNNTFVWTDVSGNAIAGAQWNDISSGGIYTCTVTDDTTGCTLSQTISIAASTLQSDIYANVYSGTVPLNVTIYNNSGGYNSVSWNFSGNISNSSFADTSFIISNNTSYTVTQTITDNLGCSATDTIYIEAGTISYIELPNVITPANTDQLNDIVKIDYEGISQFEMVMYNRWGNEVKRVTNIDSGWDGKNDSGDYVSAGVYYYLINANGNDQKTYSLKGTITVIE